MTDIIDPLQFIESQRNLLKRFNRDLEKVLENMPDVAVYVSLLGINAEDGKEWTCTIQIDNLLFIGQADTSRGAVLDCLEKAAKELGNAK